MRNSRIASDTTGRTCVPSHPHIEFQLIKTMTLPLSSMIAWFEALFMPA